MQVCFVSQGSVQRLAPEELADWVHRDDGFVWLDLVAADEADEELLTRHFPLHPQVLESLRNRNHVPTVHAYPEHTFVVLHAPLLGKAGHVHLLELDLIIGRDYLISVHGPLNPVVDQAEARTETETARRRLEAGRIGAPTPMRIAYGVCSAIARRQRTLIGQVAERLPGLEQEVMQSALREPEELLEQLFLIRHELTTVRTMAAQSHDVVDRIVAVDRVLDDDGRALVRDLADQFDRVRSIGDGESHFLFGVIDLYQTKVNTKMTVAMERLAVIAAVTLPITALSSVYGMNIMPSPYPHHDLQLVVVLLVMGLTSFLLLRWARRQGWW